MVPDGGAASDVSGDARDAARARGRLAGGIVAALLVAAGAALRIHGIADHPLWIDEYGTAWATAGDGWGALWDRVLTVQGQSPLYYALVRGSELALGTGILALRLPSVVFGIGLLLLTLPLARAAFGDRQMAIAALGAFAVNERLIFYSQEARPYALALLCAAASFLCFVHVLRGGSRRRHWQLGWIASSAATWYAHYLFGVAFAAQALYLVWRLPRTRVAWRPWLEAGPVLALLCAPGLGQLSALFGRRESLDWVDSVPDTPLGVLADYVDLPVLGISVVTAGLAAWAARAWRRPANESHLGVVALWLLVPFLVTALLPPLFGVNLVHQRYLLLAAPAVALLYGPLLALPARGRVLPWLPLLVFLCAVGGLRLLPTVQATGLFSQRYRGEQWEAAAAALLQHQRPGEPILYQTKFVELDAVVRGEASPFVVEFTTWPLAAHLPPARRTALQPLPFSDTPEMARALRERLEAAARRPRTWVVATSPALARVASEVRNDPRLSVGAHARFGLVHLLLLQGEPQ